MDCMHVEISNKTPLIKVQWEEEKKYRYNCEVLTSLLRQQVPVLDYVQWKVATVEQGAAHTMLPLISPSTNQHCTHQAALLFLAADYTGGIALASLIPNWPVVGVHPVAPLEKSMALWLVKGEIKFFRPSVGCLEIVAEVEEERHDRVRKRYAAGKPILETLTVRFRNGSVVVGEAAMTYYARQSEKLRSDGSDPDKVNILYQHKLISSAELIAGVRARETGGLFDDPFASRISGEHGVALAARFCEKSPQLGGMVAARTRHLDMQIEEFVHNGGRDIILLGAGYDMRPFRLKLPPGTTVYELDFPTVLADRQQRLATFGVKDQEGVQRIQAPIDLRLTPLAAAMAGIVDFSSPILVAWEGMTMYFEEPEVRAILSGIAPLLKNNRSRLWADFVDARAINSPDIFPEVKAFMQGMQLLGEPFVFGTKSVEAFMESAGFRCNEVVSSDVFFAGVADPVYSIYRFCVASAEVAPTAVEGAAGSALWVAHPAHEATTGPSVQASAVEEEA
jgi:methyltransferase (TIGR00027 family)